MIEWGKLKGSKEDDVLIGKIADRAGAKDRLSLVMDLTVVHGTSGLKLKELLSAADFNFFHDIGGINRHLNRETGKLEDCFSPRFAK